MCRGLATQDRKACCQIREREKGECEPWSLIGWILARRSQLVVNAPTMMCVWWGGKGLGMPGSGTEKETDLSF